MTTTTQAEFDRDTTVRQLEPGRFRAELADTWRVGGGLNGGYLLATVGRALTAAFPRHPDPLVLSAHYVSASTADPADLTVSTIREGGRTATASVDLAQDGETRIRVLATMGSLDGTEQHVHTAAQEPTLSPVEDCIPNTFAPEEIRRIAPLMERFDMRFDPDHVGWALGKPSKRGVLQAWFRLNDEREPDPLSLLLAVDALPPVTFDLGLFGWAPTLALTAHVRARPAPGWLKLMHHSRNVAGGMFEEDCEVWDSTGRLVAQGRQLALTPRTP